MTPSDSEVDPAWKASPEVLWADILEETERAELEGWGLRLPEGGDPGDPPLSPAPATCLLECDLGGAGLHPPHPYTQRF